MSFDALITWTPYERKGFSYKAEIAYYYPNIRGKITLKLDFIAYHMIKWYHGEDKLNQLVFDRIEKLKNELKWMEYGQK